MKRSSNKIYRRPTKQKRKQRKTHKKLGGGCGCNKNLFTGGRMDVPTDTGFTLQPTFNSTMIDQKYYYPVNNEMNNPNTPALQISSRLLPDMSSSGGASNKKRNKFKKHKKTRRIVNYGGTSYLQKTTGFSIEPAVLTQPVNKVPTTMV